MKYLLLILLGALFATDAFAQRRMPDMSLSVEDTMRQPNITYDKGNDQMKTGQPANIINSPRTPPRPAAEPSLQQEAPDSFMKGYCDTNTQPLIGTADTRACIEASRQQACDIFHNLPSDAKVTIERTINCLYASSEVENAVADPNCVFSDRRHLELIKTHWQDQNTVYALVFLPDLVLNAPANCITAGR